MSKISASLDQFHDCFVAGINFVASNNKFTAFQLQLLFCLYNAKDPLTTNDIVDRTQIKASTVRNILRQLKPFKFIVTYNLGHELSSYGRVVVTEFFKDQYETYVSKSV